MQAKGNKKSQILIAFVVAIFFMTGLLSLTKNVHAATTGFVKEGNATYYYKADGTKYTGWLTLSGYKYYFYKGTGKMATGWVTNANGEKRYFYSGSGKMATGWVTNASGEKRYFYKGSGVMATGWVSNSNGEWRYFDLTSGVMTKGWLTLDGNKYYFYSGSGVMATGWVTNSNGEKRYFDPKTGVMKTGWMTKSSGDQCYFYANSGIMATGWVKTSSGKYRYFSTSTGDMYLGLHTISGNKYYFDSNGYMVTNKTVTVNGTTYVFDGNGIGSVYTEPSGTGAIGSYEEYDSKNIRVKDPNGRYYLIRREILEHQGVADGTKTDLDILAAFCECEAGDQGPIGMEAVALCLLNRTIKADKEFPSSLRLALYQGGSFAQYSTVSNGAIKKRLDNTLWYFKDSAYEAARNAMIKFNNYVKYGTPRYIEGCPKNDFNYMYFMTDYAYESMPNLAFDKVDAWYFYAPKPYQDGHVFFVDWIMP